MSKLGSLLMCILIVSCIISTLFISGCTENKETRIGAILPLTGDLATYGQNARDGITLMAEEINSQGGVNGRKITIVFEDSKALPEEAVSAMQKLIQIDRVFAVIGDVASSPTLAIAPIANKNKIPIVSPAASSPDITNAGPYVFRVWPSDVFEAATMIDYVRDTNVSSVAVLYMNNDYGIAMLQRFKIGVEPIGINIVKEESFEQNTIDMRTQLTRLKQANPEAIYFISYPKETVIFLKQYKEMGLSAQVLSTSGAFEDPLILTECSNVAEGAIFTSPIPADVTAPSVAAFRSQYEKRFGKKPGLVADYGYDALNVIVQAMKVSANFHGEAIQKELEQIKNFEGATGVITFDENGDVDKPAGIRTVKNGEFVWLKK